MNALSRGNQIEMEYDMDLEAVSYGNSFSVLYYTALQFTGTFVRGSFH